MTSEFELISWIKQKTRDDRRTIKVGIGDDCAVIKQNSKNDVVITTDLLVEDVDFRRDWAKPEFIGHKSLAVSLSDIAAMGAKPSWALMSIGVPADAWASGFVEKFYKGWFKLAKKFNVKLAGGDVSRTPDKIVVDSIVAGQVKKNRAVLRSGAKPGDLIFVSGSLGGAAAGLKLLENGVNYGSANAWQKHLVAKQLTPFPQILVGQELGKASLATSMIDLSDGLSSDLAHLCRVSDVGAKIYADKIPVDKKLALAVEIKSDVLQFALNGGEDFELLFTAKKKNSNKILSRFPKISCIGEITEIIDKIELASTDETILLTPQGFRHF